MFGAADVHYPSRGGAAGALVTSADTAFAELVAEHVVTVEVVADYRPGVFADRELPVLRRLIAVADDDLELLVIDGYVDLDPQGRPGLGAKTYEAFGKPVVGVAKSPFRSATHAVPVLRGTARRPLFVTAAGLSLERAVDVVQNMSGPHRIPDALKQVDHLARAAAAAMATQRSLS